MEELKDYKKYETYILDDETSADIKRINKQCRCKHPKWTKKCSVCDKILASEKINHEEIS